MSTLSTGYCTLEVRISPMRVPIRGSLVVPALLWRLDSFSTWSPNATSLPGMLYGIHHFGSTLQRRSYEGQWAFLKRKSIPKRMWTRTVEAGDA